MTSRETNLMKRLMAVASMGLSGNQGDSAHSATALDDGFQDGEVCLSRYLLEIFYSPEERDG